MTNLNGLNILRVLLVPSLGLVSERQTGTGVDFEQLRLQVVVDENVKAENLKQTD